MKGYQALPVLLRRAGIDVAFGMVGGTNVQWLAEGVEQGSLRFIGTRHEETAVGAAAGYSRTTNTVGLCTVTRGPGFANAVNALVCAARVHVPLLCVVSESPPTGTRTPQTIDQHGLALLIGAGFHHAAGAADLEEVFWAAVRAAEWDGTPQVLSIADGVMEAETVLQERAQARPGPEVPEPAAIAEAVDLLAGAERPLLLAGRGAVLADCRKELEDLAGVTGARVASTLAANRFFSGHPADLGLSGDFAPSPARACIARSDLVLSFGASLNDYTTGKGRGFGDARVIRCEVTGDAPHGPVGEGELVLRGDAASSARALLDEWRRRGLPSRQPLGPTPQRAESQAAVMAADIGHDPARGLDPRDVYRTIDGKLPADRIVVTDTGRSMGGSLPSLVDARDARSWISGTSFASIGQGLGMAIGAAVAHPRRPVVLFCGDGGFMMAAQALDVVRLHGLDLTIVISNDGLYGSEVKYLDAVGLPRDVISHSLPDVAQLARAYEGHGQVVSSPEALAALDLPLRGLSVIDARIDPEVSARSAVA